LLLTAPSDAAAGDGEAAARLLAQVTGEVRALLQEQQDRHKAELDAQRRNVRFALGDEVLLDTEHTPLPSRSLL
jgi:NAD(P)H-hydrate repair Nnr-like enzyme with NAD(P)H-hydrate epimerase domain